MVKRCIICNQIATYKVKDTPDYYCEECAEESFGDISVLIKVEEEALKLKQFLKQNVEQCLCQEEECKCKNKKHKEDKSREDQGHDESDD